MKHLGLVPIILLLGMGLFYGPVAAELTAYQQVPSQAPVGETVTVTVMLTYNGVNSTQALVTPNLPAGVVTDSGVQTAELYPGALQPISYSIRPEQSGMYWIVSQIAYAEDGSWHNLRLEAPFDAIGGAPLEPQPMPGEQIPGGGLPGETDPSIVPPGDRPLRMQILAQLPLVASSQEERLLKEMCREMQRRMAIYLENNHPGF